VVPVVLVVRGPALVAPVALVVRELAVVVPVAPVVWELAVVRELPAVVPVVMVGVFMVGAILLPGHTVCLTRTG
jgi:hypothetical protein